MLAGISHVPERNAETMAVAVFSGGAPVVSDEGEARKTYGVGKVDRILRQRHTAPVADRAVP
jgi:hypothetical protein